MQMKEYTVFVEIPWRKKYEKQIKSVAICYGASLIVKYEF